MRLSRWRCEIVKRPHPADVANALEASSRHEAIERETRARKGFVEQAAAEDWVAAPAQRQVQRATAIARSQSRRTWKSR